MLSYLKEGQGRIPATETPAEAGGAEAPLSRQDDYLTVSGHSQKLRQSTLLLAVLFGVGALGVWFMIKKTTPAPALAATADDQTQLEAAIAQLSGMQTEMNTQMDSVVGRFYQFSNVGQVHVEELQKNPFKREAAAGQIIVDEAALRRETQQRLEDRVNRMAHGLQLWSITATPRGVCCMIDDRVLYVGDEINGLTVSRIEPKSVELTHDGVSVQLKMDE